ncbi:MAG: DUF134 domain-containing protein [Deltaproteobacteria bacterium]|nr:DUF134 domain-containing protein [Deltaproteobacteria bacterium]
MARKPQCRRIGGYPDCWIFSPEESSKEMPVVLNLDEYESIRLIDHENLTQEQCAQCMGVARTTVTAIYDSARKKLAAALVEGRTLRIGGGCYRIDNGKAEILLEKGENIMRIAVTYENGEIFQHFGHTEQFKLYDVEDGKIVHTQVVDTGECGHGALGGFLKAARVDALICGGIGMGAQNALAEAGIQLFGGVQGNADAAAQALAEGKLQYDPQAQCDHHGHGGHHGGPCHGGQSGRCH